MKLTIELDKEVDGRWIAEVLELSGVLVYGATAAEAIVKAKSLALAVLAERLAANELSLDSVSFIQPAA